MEPMMGRIAFGPRVEDRPIAFPVPVFNKGDIMPATKADVAELRGLLYYFDTAQKTHLSDMDRRRYADTLRRVIRLLEYGDPQSPIWWVAGALRKAVRKVAPGIYITQDRPLETWAFDQLFELLPDPDEG